MIQTSFVPPVTASSQKLALTAATVHSTIWSAPGQADIPQSAVIHPTQDCYFRMNDTAAQVVATNGTDMFLKGGFSYRLVPIPDGMYLHFIRDTADGSVYITPNV